LEASPNTGHRAMIARRCYALESRGLVTITKRGRGCSTALTTPGMQVAIGLRGRNAQI
jgi:hypothetical protein